MDLDIFYNNNWEYEWILTKFSCDKFCGVFIFFLGQLMTSCKLWTMQRRG